MFKFLSGLFSRGGDTVVESPYFPPGTTLQQQKLVRCGTGTRARLGVEVYDMALYLPRTASNATEAVAMDGAKQLRFIAKRRINGNDLATALFTGIRKNLTKEDELRYLPLVQEVIAVFKRQDHIDKGHTFRIDLIPGEGALFYIDDELQGKPVNGPGFNEAVLKVWIGDNPADATLKAKVVSASGNS